MTITAAQLVAHSIGDYLLQSHWMATQKTKRSLPALCHVLTYGLPFLLFRPSLTAYLFIVVSHFVIDRWRLARFVIYAKNFLSPPYEYRLHPDAKPEEIAVDFEQRVNHWHRWKECSTTGYHQDVPVWLSTWLLIIADNLMHVLLNAVALSYL